MRITIFSFTLLKNLYNYTAYRIYQSLIYAGQIATHLLPLDFTFFKLTHFRDVLSVLLLNFYFYFLTVLACGFIERLQT